MADIALSSQLTLIELAKRTNNKDILEVAEVLSRQNDWMEDAVWVESNQPTSHVHSRRLSQPTGSYRMINEGVSEEASRVMQIVEGIGSLEAYSTVDYKLVQLAGDKKKFRSIEDRSFLHGLGQTMADTLVYGNKTTYPARFDGWATRYGTINNQMVYGAGGTGNNCTSAWFVRWSEEGVYMIFPKGSETGIKVTDLGQQTVYNNSNPYQAYRTWFVFDAGQAIADDKSIGRLANIKAANAWTANTSVAILNEMPERGKGVVIYVNFTVLTQIDVEAMNKNNAIYYVKEVFGKPTVHFRGAPIKPLQALNNTELTIS